MGDNLVKEIFSNLKDVNRRLTVIIIVLIIALVGTNAYWMYDYTQWEYVEEYNEEYTQEYQVETNGNQSPAIINTGGDVDVESEVYKEKDDEKNENEVEKEHD